MNTMADRMRLLRLLLHTALLRLATNLPRLLQTSTAAMRKAFTRPIRTFSMPNTNLPMQVIVTGVVCKKSSKRQGGGYLLPTIAYQTLIRLQRIPFFHIYLSVLVCGAKVLVNRSRACPTIMLGLSYTLLFC